MYTQILASILGIMSTFLCATIMAWNQWAVTGPESSSLAGPIWAWRGLWGDCMQYMGGQYQCEEQASIMEDPAYLIIIRALMCISIAFSAIASVASLIGLQCSKLLDDTPNRKRTLMFISAGLHGTAAVFILASVAWYTGLMVRDYFSFETQDNVFRYEIGAAVYLGYGSALLSFLAFLACACMPGPKDETKYVPPYSQSYQKSSSGFLIGDKMEYV